MSREFEEIAHTGGKIKIRENGSVQYTHANPSACVLIPVAVKGHGVLSDPDGSNAAYQSFDFEVYLISDREGMFGRICPRCGEYFRTDRVPGEMNCPYCFLLAPPNAFLTDPQKKFLQAYVDTITSAMNEGEKEIDLDALVNKVDGNISPFAYNEIRQQTTSKCPECRTKFDIFGLYGACPTCGRRNSIDIFEDSMSALAGRIENPRYDKKQRHLREAEWEEAIKSSVSYFEGLATDMTHQLALIPLHPRRRKHLQELSFMNPIKAGISIDSWFAIDMFAGTSDDDKTFISRFFARRHLLTHRSGIVDQEYIDSTGDTSLRVGHKLRVRSREASRFVDLVRRLGSNLFNDISAILKDSEEHPNKTLKQGP